MPPRASIQPEISSDLDVSLQDWDVAQVEKQRIARGSTFGHRMFSWVPSSLSPSVRPSTCFAILPNSALALRHSGGVVVETQNL